jgi:seryl-tRNA synthetase
MIDLTLLRENPVKLTEVLKKKDPSFPVERLIQLDQQVREVRNRVESLRHEKNEITQRAHQGITQEQKQRSIEISKELKHEEELLNQIQHEFKALYLTCPNLIVDEVPTGGKEANHVVKEYGKKPEFSFPIKNHLALATELGWIDFEAAARMTGSQFAFYKDDGVRLLYALALFMLSNNHKHGFQVVLPPYLVNEESLEVASNFPKFKDQVYAVPEDDLYLTPTAEVNLTNIYRNHIFEKQELPLRMTAWTSCFRREAGGYGATERGLIRIHQFEKVELYTICTPEHSSQEQARMVSCAEDILQKLGLSYRISLLAAQDCSFPSAKTYDIEVWLPGQNQYYEVSSISNCTDFQARRGLMRYREKGGEKPHLVHTLNGSSLALPRLMVALMEVYQQADGTIQLPSVLKPYMFF